MGALPSTRRLLLLLLLLHATVPWEAQEGKALAEEAPQGTLEEEEGVLVLNQHNFDQALQKHQLLLVEFCAPSYEPCQALAPEYAKAAAMLKGEGPAVRLARVHSQEEQGLSVEFGVSRYPVLKLFTDGNRTHPTDFTGQQDAEGIVRWLKRKAGPSAIPLQGGEEAAAFLSSHTVAVIGFFHDQEDEDVRVFLEVASDAPDVAFAFTDCPKLFQEYNITRDAVSLFRKPGERRADYLVDEDLGLDKDELAQFIRAHSLELVMEFTSKNASRIFGAQMPNHLLLFINKTVESQLELLSSFQGAAPAFWGQVLFVLADVGGEGAQLLHFFGLKRHDAPALRFINITTDKKYRLATEGLSVSAVITFCQAVLAGKVQPHLMSEEIPEDWDKHPVKILVGKNFDQVAFDETKNVFVKFYAPWCVHSKAMAAAWKELGEKYEAHADVVIAQMDATANEVAELTIRAYPTLYYFPAGPGRQMIEYSEARDLESFSLFLEHGGRIPPGTGPKTDSPPAESQEEATPEPRSEL